MHKLSRAILEHFQAHKGTHSTGDLVHALFSQETKEQNNNLSVNQTHNISALEHSLDEKTKALRATQHRKLLYHLNKLVEENILLVTGIQGRGEKRYALVSHNISITDKKTTITITQKHSIETPIDSYVGAQAYDKETWLQKINALLLESEGMTLAEAAQRIEELTPYVNDVIGVLHFEQLLGSGDIEEFLDRLRRFPCVITLVISLSQVTDQKKIMRFCRAYAANKPENVQLVFNANPRTLSEHKELFLEVIEKFMEKRIKLNIKNNTHLTPIICGIAGTYTIEQDAWRAYTKKRTKGIALVGASVILDLQKQRLHEAAKKGAEALFLVNRNRDARIQKLRSQGITISYMDDMIRCWNYDLENETLEEEIRAAKEVVKDFWVRQERIYRACGIPIRSHIRLGSTFGKTTGLTPRAYKKITVNGIFMLQEEEYKEYLKKREALAQLFLSDRVRIFRSETNNDDVFRELFHLISTYTLPYITYDFSKRSGETKLTAYLEQENILEEEL